MNNTSSSDNSLVVSYLVLRKSVGYLGIALPFVLAFGGMLVDKFGIQSSISSYYYTDMRNVFVGTLCAIAVFLSSYRGYDFKDRLAGVLACLFALGVAFFPTAPDSDPSPHQNYLGHAHLLFAALFFLTLTYFSLCLFTKTDKNKKLTRMKGYRNIVYRVCGYTMLIALVLMVVLALLSDQAILAVKRLALVFWLESIAIVAFGISWLTKGEGILKDET